MTIINKKEDMVELLKLARTILDDTNNSILTEDQRRDSIYTVRYILGKAQEYIQEWT